MTRRRNIHGARRKFAAGCCAVIASSLLAACGVMESYRIDPILTRAEHQPGVICKSDLGSYALPKAFVHIVVRKEAAAAPDIVSFANARAFGGVSAVEIRRYPDRSLVFCLDYLASSLSHDVINVKKWPTVEVSSAAPAQELKSSFLGAVLINARDRTVFVIEALIRAAFIAASGNPEFAPRNLAANSAAELLADLEFDPFDPRESAEVNTRLSSLGICLVLEGYTFDRDRTSVDSYCNSPKSHATWTTPILKAYAKVEATPANPLLPGLLYRPRVPYRLFVYRKLDPGGRDRWKLSETQQVALENLSPVLSLDVRRAAFAGRNANFVFDSGTLVTACVAKNSEIEGFVDIPLQISRSLVALPASIAKVQIDQVGFQKRLIEAESQLMQVQKAYLAALQGNAFTSVSGIPDNGGTLPNPTKLTMPADLKVNNDIASAPVYGDDLFGTHLDNICKGGG